MMILKKKCNDEQLEVCIEYNFYTKTILCSFSFHTLCLQHRFYFDQVFGEESSNEDVYQRTAYPLVQHMLNG